MAEAAGGEYVTDVTYVRAFEADLAPARIRLAAALNGFVVPPAKDFTYCELGCAHGDTTVTLAAAYPDASFFGVDLNEQHVESGRALARRGDVANVRFLLRDFEELAREDLPELDYIGAHGVLSWVGPRKRKAILDFARARLKPGGMLEVSYNALPGWAAIEPLRQLLVGRAGLSQGDSIARAGDALAFAKTLMLGGAEYFTQNPAARSMLHTMERHGLAYVVHEYLHAHWVPMYFAQLAAEMAESGLHFVGQLPLYLNYRDIAIPSALLPVFEPIQDRIAYESLKDFALNEFFRRDVYVKGLSHRSPENTSAYLDATPVGTLLGEGELRRDVALPHHTLHFVGDIFDALMPALAEGATSALDLSSRPELAGYGRDRVRAAVLRLLIGGQVSPMQERTRARPVPEDARLEVVAPHNRAALAGVLTCEDPIVLASAKAGTGFEMTRIDALALYVSTEVPREERAAWIDVLCRKDSFHLATAEGPIADPTARLHFLLDEIQRFRRNMLPKLVELGVVASA